MNTITFDNEERDYWRQHSGILEDLLEEDDTVSHDLLNVLTDTEFRFLKDMVEGKGAFVFKNGKTFPNSKKGYTKEMLIKILDYIDFESPRTMLNTIKRNIAHSQINAPRLSLPHGKGVATTRKITTTNNNNNRGRRNERNYNNGNYNEVNNNNNNSNKNNNKNTDKYLERAFMNHNNTKYAEEQRMTSRLSMKQEKNLATTRRKQKGKKGKKSGYTLKK